MGGLFKKYAKKALKMANPVNAIKALSPKKALGQIKELGSDLKGLGQDIGLIKKKGPEAPPAPEEFIRPSGEFPGVETIKGQGLPPAPVAPTISPEDAALKRRERVDQLRAGMGLIRKPKPVTGTPGVPENINQLSAGMGLMPKSRAAAGFQIRKKI